jgi:NADH-quinone oxidoreductase subunit H
MMLAAQTLAGQILEQLPFLEGIPGWLLYPTLLTVGCVLAVAILAVFVLFAVWMERKVSAHMQCRLGPMEAGGFHGWLQTLVDGVKLLSKEDLVPKHADRIPFLIAPIIAFTGVFLTFVVIPFDRNVIVADLNIGIFYIAAVSSIEVLGVLMAGYASNNKWSLFGAMRSAAQMVVYEIPLGISILAVAVAAGTLSMQGIIEAQSGWFWNWFVFRNPFLLLLFVIFFLASMCECKRAPFDLPEAESELVSGFHTEYSGMRFAMFLFAEYGALFVASAVAAVAFFGGWRTGIPVLDDLTGVLGIAVGMTTMLAKATVFVFIQMWARWTLPRVRLDHMFTLCLKYLLPFSLIGLVGVCVWQLALPSHTLWFFVR